MKRSPVLLLCCVLLLLGAAACAGGAPAASASAASVQPLVTRTSAPTETPLPSPAPTGTATPPPRARASATPSRPACRQAGGRLERASLSTPLLTLPMEVTVYLPPCYGQNAGHYYPVLYLLHGQNYTQEQWVRLGVPQTADALMGAGEIPPYLIVMPHDRLWEDPPDTNFDEAFLEVLLPWVDSTYRTVPVREFRAVGGLSRGGAWAIHFGLQHWELFGALGGHSAPVFWSDTPYIGQWLDAIPPEALPRIYLDIGEKDYLRDSNAWFEAQLTARDIPHEWHLYRGYHEEAYWQAHVEEYLRWYGRLWGGP